MLIVRGVDVLITDEPTIARKVLQNRAAMGSLERILLKLAGILGVRVNIGEQ